MLYNFTVICVCHKISKLIKLNINRENQKHSILKAHFLKQVHIIIWILVFRRITVVTSSFRGGLWISEYLLPWKKRVAKVYYVTLRWKKRVQSEKFPNFCIFNSIYVPWIMFSAWIAIPIFSFLFYCWVKVWNIKRRRRKHYLIVAFILTSSNVKTCELVHKVLH